MSDTEDIEVEIMDEPELHPDVVLDPEDTHTEGEDPDQVPSDGSGAPAPVEEEQEGEDGNAEPGKAE